MSFNVRKCTTPTCGEDEGFWVVSGAIVFGGAGFIGAHVLQALADQGVSPLLSADIAEPAHPVAGVQYVHCDVREPIEMSGAGIETVYNLAGLVTTPGHPDAEYFQTNVTGALTVCAFADRWNVQRLVYMSTMSVYPTGESLKTEQSPLEPVNSYGASKAMGESISLRWLNGDADKRLLIVRPAVIFGPGEIGNFRRLHRLVTRGWFIYPGRMDTIKACGYVTDLVRSLDFAWELPGRMHLFNFAYPDRCTISDIVGLISAELGKRPPRIVLPSWLMNAGARGFEVLEAAGLRTGINRARIAKLRESTNIYPAFLLDHDFQFSVSLREGVRRWLGSLPARRSEPAGIPGPETG